MVTGRTNVPTVYFVGLLARESGGVACKNHSGPSLIHNGRHA